MKIRMCFVSNSSSSSFVITNISNQPKNLLDFAKETSYLAKEFAKCYYDYSNVECDLHEAEYIKSALQRIEDGDDTMWNPNESLVVVFGDEDEDVIGTVCDYMLRSRGSTESFTWTFKQSLR